MNKTTMTAEALKVYSPEVECQYCESTNTYPAGHSPFCVETQYKCRECEQDTWY